MDFSLAITQFLGIICVAIGISMIVDKKGATAALGEATRNRGFLWIFGFIALTTGAVIIVMNNVWTSGLPLFVTIVGWLSLVKGCYILIFPDAAISLYSKYNKGPLLAAGGVVIFIIGMVLLYLGFM